MARTVVIDLRDFAGQAAGEHPSGRDKVMVWAPEFRASTQGGWTTGPLPRTFYFNGAPVRIPDVEPGQIVIQFHVRQLQGQDTFTVNVPAGSGEVRLSELMADAFEYDPPIISEAQRTLMSAREALNKATGLKQDVEKLTSETKDQLDRSVDKAQGDLNKAVDTAQANLNKAVETATTSWSNQLETMQGSISSLLNSTRTTTEQILKDHKAQVAKSQQIQKDMQNVLDTISWSGDKLSVNGKQSPSLTGPRGQAGPPGPKGDPGASAWSDVTGKPSTFPPDTHKHKMADISDFPEATENPTPDSLVKRDSTGSFLVQRPQQYAHAANKGYVDSAVMEKADKNHTHTSADISDTTNDAGSSEHGGRVLVPRAKDGKIFYYSDPTEYRELARKGYVDSVGNTKADKSHKHTMADISDLPAIGFTEGTIAKYASGSTLLVHDSNSQNTATSRGYVDGEIKKKADKSHTHTSADISDAVEAYVLKADGNNANRLIRSDSRGRLTVQDANYSDTATAVVNKKYVDTTAFPLAITSLGAKEDLDNFKSTGVYHQALTANAKNGTNYPVGVAGLLEVFNPDASMVYQRYTVYGGGIEVWVRGYYQNKWYRWQKVENSGHKHTVSDISDLPKIDTNVSGNSLVQRYSNGAILVPDPPPTSTSATSKSYVDSRIQVVSSLPSSPKSDVLYVITE